MKWTKNWCQKQLDLAFCRDFSKFLSFFSALRHIRIRFFLDKINNEHQKVLDSTLNFYFVFFFSGHCWVTLAEIVFTSPTAHKSPLPKWKRLSTALHSKTIFSTPILNSTIQSSQTSIWSAIRWDLLNFQLFSASLKYINFYIQGYKKWQISNKCT